MMRNSALVGAITAQQHSLNKPGNARCMCCNELKPANSRWRVAGYLPDNPAHPAVAYAVCGDCLASKKKLSKGARGIETMARDMAERKATT